MSETSPLSSDLLPRPSVSYSGRSYEGREDTISKVKSFLRASEYEQNATKGSQERQISRLAQPKFAASEPHDWSADRWKLKRAGDHNASHAHKDTGQHSPMSHAHAHSTPGSPSRLAPLSVPAAARRHTVGPRSLDNSPKSPALRRGSWTPDARSSEFDEKYSETPMHLQEMHSKVFDIPDFIARERAVITAGRTFTWGGRMRYKLPGFNPSRNHVLKSFHS
eukprot:jgi/Mesvir1/11987/Mv00296-RA.1